MDEINYKTDCEAENKYLKKKIKQLEQEVKELKALDNYEKIPYWFRPDFQINFTYNKLTCSKM